MSSMRLAVNICALFVTLSVFSGATCRKSTGVETGNAGAQSKKTEAVVEKRGDSPDASEEKPQDPFALIPRMSVKELKQALDEGRAVVADVRPEEAYEEEHIEGAFSVPEEDWAARAGDLPKDKLVVTY
ncbi:MAG: hypothetical protein H0T60_10015, partial [Acidobacteria bacterium]|nr:hypothetical protein [Acidobacteriota bacterium]